MQSGAKLHALQCIVVLVCGCLGWYCSGYDSYASSGLEIGNFRNRALHGDAPEGWQLQKHKGNPSLMIEQEGRHFFLRMVASGNTAFGIKKAVSIDTHRYPFLQWIWRVQRLPDGGDIRWRQRDDQAMQLYIIFPATGFPEIYKSPTIAYIWDNEAPKGLITGSPQKMLGYVRYIVLRNKSDSLGLWQTETRNIEDDYRKLFADVNGGQPPGPIRTILLFINTHHTKSAADGSIGEITFLPEVKK